MRTSPSEPGLPGSVWLLCLCQGLGLTVAVLSVDVAALAGAKLCTSMALSTVPYGLQFAAAMVTGPTASAAMARVGRPTVFRTAAAVGCAAGLVGSWAIAHGSFILLCTSHLMLGAFLATANLFRFAALDVVSSQRRQTAMTIVMSGGVCAAVLGPLICRHASEVFSAPAIQASYLAMSLVSACAFALLHFVKMPPDPTSRSADGPRGRSGSLIGLNTFTVAVLAGAVGYGLMNLLMVAASIDMAATAFDLDSVSVAIQVHVFFMFAPSFAAGWLIRRFGIFGFLLAGVGLQIVSALIAVRGTGFGDYAVSLAFLAVSWNALYVGGSTLVGQSVSGAERFRAQGLNEVAVAVASTAGALFSGSLLSIVGWHGLQALAITAAVGFGCFAYLVWRREAGQRRCADEGAAARHSHLSRQA